MEFSIELLSSSNESKKFLAGVYISVSPLLSSCSVQSSTDELKPRTVEENQAITDSWYPIKNDECQIFVDAFGLAQTALGSNDSGYLFENMEEIRQRIKQSSEVIVGCAGIEPATR